MSAVAGWVSDKVRQTPATGWRTSIFLVLTAAAGRWIAGPTFGYALFAIVWSPISATSGSLSRVRTGEGAKPHVRGLTALTIAVLFSAPWWFDETAAAAGRMTLVLTASTLASAAVGRLAGVTFRSRAAGGAVAIVVWLTWLTLPLVRPDAVAAVIGPDRLATVLNCNPVVALNAASATAGDWTHQAVAYRWLTRLGQDVEYAVPASVGTCAGVHVGIAVVSVLAVAGRSQRNVPRGTFRL